MKLFLTGIAALLCLLPYACIAQDQPGPGDKILNFPTSFFNKTQDRAQQMDRALSRQTERYLRRLAKAEDRLRHKLAKQDSAAAAKILGAKPFDYAALSKAASASSGKASIGGLPSSTYLPYLDSVKTSLQFAQQYPQLLSGGTIPGNALPNVASWRDQAGSALSQVQQLQTKIQVTDQIGQLVRQRKDQIREALAQYSHLPSGLQHSYQAYSQQAYYYSAQVQQYKDALSDPDKLTQKALAALNQSPQFQSFMKSHSELSGLFSTPGGEAPGTAQTLAGLQTRSQVQEQLHGQVSQGGSNGQQVIQQQIQSARAQLQTLKDKVGQLGGGSSTMDIPDFRPNPMRTHSFLKRLEYGANIQSLPSTYSLPVTTDFGLYLGYKLSDRNKIGLGASYKMGWGKDIGHISVSSQGVGLRSFWETKLKGSLFLYSGFEYNYQQPIYSFSQIDHLSYWTKSGLVGLSKRYSLGNKVKGNVQLLWDFLSYQAVPRQSALKFRVGYNF